MNKGFSEFLKLNWFDILKGAIVAVASAVVASLLSLLNSGRLPAGDDWKGVGVTALTALLAYLLKNFLSNSEGEPLKKEGV